MNGQVIIHFSDGSKFKGMYKDGRRNGAAIEEDKDGKRFEGSYVNGRRDGNFVEKDRNGQILKRGHYENGKRFED